MNYTPRRIDRGARTVYGDTVTIVEGFWPDGYRFFAVYRPDGTELTTDGRFDALPTDDELLNLVVEHRDLWHCPSCYTTIRIGEHDLIADHRLACFDGSEDEW